MDKAPQQRSAKQAISDETVTRKQALFNKYVMPYNRMIYKLVRQYTFKPANVEDNYWEVLTNMYKYIESYDTSRSIHTWLHIVTKRCVFDLDQRREKQNEKWNYEYEVESFSTESGLLNQEHQSADAMGIENYRELYNDDILEALDQLKPQYRRALLLQQAGYKLKEIAEIEYRNGALDSKNIETVKSRLLLARRLLQQLLTRDGKRRIPEEED